MREAWVQLERGQNQDVLEFDSDLSEAVEFANQVFGAKQGRIEKYY